MNQALLSSATAEWQTPRDLFHALDDVFQFTLDAAATKENALCMAFYSREHCGLLHTWKGYTVWCNPPYGREVGHWVAKAHEEYCNGTNSVLLLPARTDTKWFQKYCTKATSLLFFSGRLKFGGQATTNPAPFPSVLVLFGDSLSLNPFRHLGWVVNLK